MMDLGNLSQEFARFCKQTKHLRQLLRETQKCFQDITSLGNSYDQPNPAEISKTEEQEIEAIVRQPPGLVISGQTCNVKAAVVNKLFGKTILPVTPVANGVRAWRTVRFKYSKQTTVSLSLPGSFELVDNLVSYQKGWKTIPVEDLEIGPDASDDVARKSAVLEVRLDHPLLKEGVVTVAQGWGSEVSVKDVHSKCTEDITPVFIYAIARDTFTAKEEEDLRKLKELVPDISIFFVQIYSSPSNDKGNATSSKDTNGTVPSLRNLKNVLETNRTSKDVIDIRADTHVISGRRLELFQELVNLGYLSMFSPSLSKDSGCEAVGVYSVESELLESFDNFAMVVQFTRCVLQNYLIKATSLLHLVHTRCVQMFITTAFEMARDMQVTPRKLEFAKMKESELYSSLMEIALKKQDEIRRIIAETVSGMRDTLLSKAAAYQFIGVDIPNSGEIVSLRELKICTGQIQELVLGTLNSAIAGRLLGSVDILKDSYTGVLTRCLESLEQSDKENTESTRTSLALREILNAAYQVDITVRHGSSLIRVLLEKMKQLIHSMPWRTPPKIDAEWKRKVAADMLNSLSENRLARSICAQIKERLRQSHDMFANALKQLESRHSGRLEKTEERRLRVRKVYAPKVARLALESTSLRDSIIFGMPTLGREIGRGQYGVVYACDKWSVYGPCAIKTVVPPDDKHWNDLALEFYYTKNVPEHPRVVALRGSVIDYSYGSGAAVLLIMDRLERDLYSAIKGGLDWLSRLQVAIDVVQGIRFLHSQGLVHRDIKLKNVLLDKRNHGKITDLGFCKPEAMMSGSIVGTPIHMAPELFSGKYDNSVDVYAFGILFWYVCAGHIRLPFAFDQCTNKEMLWTSVKRGVRPEKLSIFDEECWVLMRECWESEPIQRPLLGSVEPRLVGIIERFRKHPRAEGSPMTSRHEDHLEL